MCPLCRRVKLKKSTKYNLNLFRKKYNQYTDEELVRAIVKGNEKAFDELYQRYAEKMHTYFYHTMGKDNMLANDFTQELFIRIIEKGKLFDPEKRFSSWIYAVAGNMCKNEFRRQKRHTIPGLPADAEQRMIAHGSSDHDFDQAVFDKYLYKALNTMEAPHRECFLLRYQQELSIKEISDIMDCPEGTVKSRLYYTTKKLSEMLEFFKPDHLKKKDYETAGNRTGKTASSKTI